MIHQEHAPAGLVQGIGLSHGGNGIVGRRGADQLTGSYDQRAPDHLAALGLLLLRGVTAASRGGDRAAVREFLTEAAEVARYVQVDRPDSWANFSTTNLALHAISAHVSLGDAGAALHEAAPLMRRRIPAPERRAALWLDVARAHSQLGNLSEAHHALRLAQSTAPEDVRRPAVLELVADLAARDRSGRVPELRRLCEELGVQA